MSAPADDNSTKAAPEAKAATEDKKKDQEPEVVAVEDGEDAVDEPDKAFEDILASAAKAEQEAKAAEEAEAAAKKAAEPKDLTKDEKETSESGNADAKATNEDGSRPQSSAGGDENDEEKDFEPSIDMMLNDFDDERTMEEEEALENEKNAAEEVDALNEEGDMPLEELMKLYGYQVPPGGAPKDSAAAEPVTEDVSSSGRRRRRRIVPVVEETKDQPESEAVKEETKTESKAEEKDETETKVEPSRVDAGGEDADAEADEEDEDEDDEEEDASFDDGEARGKKRSLASAMNPSGGKRARSELADFYEGVKGRSLRSSGGQGGDDDYDYDASAGGGGAGGDSENEGRDYSWKKTIMIGPSFQASVPSGLSNYDDHHTLPYENEDRLLWDPTKSQTEKVDNYLSKCQEALLQASGVSSLPIGAHIRDDEQALHLLLQCGYNFDEALRRRRLNPVPPADTMSLWSEEECRAFELGLRLYGKDFHMIQLQKVKTRSVGELVQFYYLWKKTERHDVFANATRMEKKKYILHPGITDYMDRFIDDQDPSKDHSVVATPNYLLYGGSDGRRQGLMSSNNRLSEQNARNTTNGIHLQSASAAGGDSGPMALAAVTTAAAAVAPEAVTAAANSSAAASNNSQASGAAATGESSNGTAAAVSTSS